MNDVTSREVSGMKKCLCIALICLVIGASALAAVPQLSSSLFSSAKQALVYLASGEYERLVTLLPFSGVAPSAAEWERFAANFSDLSAVQTDYAVAFWMGSVWAVAVPVQPPENGAVEALVLGSDDGSTFSGYAYDTWSHVQSLYSQSDSIIWNDEYVSGAPTIVAD